MAPRVATTTTIVTKRSGGWSVHDGQGPAPAGQLAGDGDVGDDVAFAAQVESDPPLVRSPVAGVAAGSGGGCGEFPAVAHGLADGVAGAVVPGGLDQQSPNSDS